MSVTFAEAVDRWYDERSFAGYVQPYTAQKSREKASYFVPRLGDTPIDEIRPIDISDVMREMRTKGGREDKGLSLTTIRAAHLAATQACDWAVGYDLATTNPFRKVKRPKAQFRQMGYLDVGESARMVALATREMVGESVSHASFLLAVILALSTGMRRGEIFALTWDAVDFDAGRIRVSKAIKAGGEVGRPKSASGTRNVAVGRHALDALRRHRKICRGESVICDASGRMANMSTFEHWWRRWTERNGFGRLRFHELRHSHATALITGGVDVKTVQHRLGHSSADITMSVYAHAIPSADVSAADALDGALFKEVDE